MNQYPKRLIEVDLPIKRISEHARREKDMRSGHVPLMAIWPATRPTTACRAVICASLWFDPADERCPEQFRKTVRDEMRKWGRDHRDLMSAESFQRFEAANKDSKKYEDNENLRFLLLDFIADFANWDNSTSTPYLDVSRRLTENSHIANGGETGTRPLVVDPFAGGGAIPMEALRIGADSYAGDLNPIASNIQRVVLDIAPRFREKLRPIISEAAQSILPDFKARLADFYPLEANGNIPIAYLWAKTILSEDPSAQTPVEVPMLRSLVLAKKGDKSVALRFVRDNENKIVCDTIEKTFSDSRRLIVRRPRLEIIEGKAAQRPEKGTLARGSVTCPVTGYTTPVSSVRKQLIKRAGGANDSLLYAVVSKPPSGRGRSFRVSTDADLEAFANAEVFLKELSLKDIPSEPIPLMSGVFNAPLYGHEIWSSLFNPRQLIAHVSFIDSVRKFLSNIQENALKQSVAAIFGLLLNKLVDLNSAMCVWQVNTPNAAHAFGRWALPMITDFAEINPLAEAGGSPENSLRRLLIGLDTVVAGDFQPGQVSLTTATSLPLPDDSVTGFFTDPPYYNAIPYADLSDYFYVWSKRLLHDIFPDAFGFPEAPKNEEICEMAGWDPIRFGNKNAQYFEDEMTRALEEGRRVLRPDGIASIVFAHKSTTGWEAMLQATINSGWIITNSWPIDTEMASRLRAKNSAALASSIYLVCRPREDADGTVRSETGDWRDVLRELPIRIHQWMPRLTREGVVGADAIFACLGPALEIFSQYSSVEKPNGDEVKLGEYLEHVWAAVSKEALNMIFEGADATGFEEDARLTAMWLWTLNAGASDEGQVASDESEENDDSDESSGKKAKASGYVLEFDAARKIAQGLGAHLEDLDSIVEVKGDKATLISVSDRGRDLFGYKESSSTTGKKKKKTKSQGKLFIEMEDDEYETVFGIGGAPKSGETTLDRVHQTMLLFGAGRSEAVKRFLVDDGNGNDERFWRLANALSALYPSGSQEKRWVDGVLARKKGLGF